VTPGAAPRVGCYPGSFNPLTLAHLALAEAAVSTCRLDRVDLVVSRVPLAKEHVDRPSLEDRLSVLAEAVEARQPWLGLVVSERQLLVDLAAGYDVLVMGTDKWSQIRDAAFYGDSATERDAALARLPQLAIAHRPGTPLVDPGSLRVTILRLPRAVADVSSTAARAGRRSWMAPEGGALDRRTGAWSEPERYSRWRREGT